MTAAYRDILKEIRLAFPQPVSDPIHDSYFVHSIMRALDQVDALKSHLPILGAMVPGDFAEARRAALPEKTSSVEAVTSDLVGYLRGMTIFGHPRTQQNVIPPPTIPSLIGVMLAALHNPNVAWDEYSRLVALAEVEAAGITARLVGYDPEQASGVFTFGGTGTTLYGVKIGLEKACPGTMQKGHSEDAVLIVSEAGHYCAANIAGWLGMGTDNLITVPTTEENEIDLDHLGREAREALGSGKRIAAIIATLGTTDAFGLDDLQAIAALRDSLVEEFQLPWSPHIHADAVIGWAWSVFDDYDFEGNPLGFRPRTVRALAGACRRIRPPVAGRLPRRRLPQDRVRPLRLQPRAGEGPGGPSTADAGSRADALPLPLRRPPARHVHPRDLQGRHRSPRRPRQLPPLRRAGAPGRARASRRDGPAPARASRRP